MTSRRCPTCGGTVQDDAGRFCPHCGSTLPESPSEMPGAHRGHEDVAAAQSEAMRAAGRGPKLIALAVLAIGAVVLLASWAGWFPDQTQDTAGDDVELPDLGDPDEGDDQQAGDPDDADEPDEPDDADDASDTDPLEDPCEPDGCARWSVPAGPGPVLVADGRILHLDAGELLAIDAASGDVTALGPSDVQVGAPTGLLLVERADGDLLLVHDGARVEAWDLGEERQVWTSDDHGPDERFGGVVRADDDVVVVLEVRQLDEEPERQTVAYDTATGERRWSRDGFVLATTGAIVVAEPVDSSLEQGEAVLVDAASGEVRATVDPGDFLGGTDDRVALVRDDRIAWLSWPELDEVADLGPADSGLGIINGHLVSGPDLVATTPSLGLAVDQVTEVFGPVANNLVASYDEPAAVGQRIGGAGAVVAERDGSTVTVTAVDADWQERWRSEVTWEPSDDQPLRVRPSLEAVNVAGGGGDGTDEHVRLDWRTGLLKRDGAFGQLILDEEVTATFGELTMRASAEQVVLAGPDGEVTFGASAEILHASEPLLVRDGDRLIAVEELLVSAP